MSDITVTGTKVTHPAYSTKNSVTLSDPKNGAPGPLILDTLAQLAQKGPSRLLLRARSKYLTGSLAIGLAELHSPLEKYYRNAFYCNHTLVQVGETVTGKYCNSRICYVCNRIRTAKLINGYATQLKAMRDARFVTLTRTNVSGDILRDTVSGMLDTVRRILRRYNNRGKVTHNGIRKIEITHNTVTDTFHPHFHFVCDGLAVAEQLVADWLELNPGITDIKAQDIRPVDENSLLELFKYSTKLVVKRDGRHELHLQAVDVITRALYGRRIIQPYGRIRRVSEDVDDLRSDSYPELPEYDLMEWCWHEHDWIGEGGECLTGFTPYVDKMLRHSNNSP